MPKTGSRNKTRTASRGAYKPKVLGKSVTGPLKRVDLVPWGAGEVLVRLDCREFTTICPVTGQPDFGRLEIEYVPGAHLIETKSLKLYLQGYRDRKGFNEEIVATLTEELFRQAKPKSLRVTGHYNARGGIAVTCVAERGAIEDED
ncbi:preQ(1) synthase [bacterium]|nr:preQ(1) synthase [bacterium]